MYKIITVLISIGILISPVAADEQQKYSSLANQAYVELHESYNRCRGNAAKHTYWTRVSECIAKKETDCMNKTSHQMLSFTEKELSLEHCAVLKPSIEQLSERVTELKKQEPMSEKKEMSESPPLYGHVPDDLEQMQMSILDDPDASEWLKQAVVPLWKRDPEEALRDLERLRQLLERRL